MFIYGSEGIGKSTMAAQMPDPIFIDVESGTNQLPVARMPKPTSWDLLAEEVKSIRDGDIPSCRTLVIDTADAAENLCVSAVCANNDVTVIEKLPYGKGYTYVKEYWCRMLDLLSEVTEHGINVVLLGHARMDKFERPDESGAYDRFSPKLIDSKRASVAAATKEWADAVLFLDYKIYVEDVNGKAKAHGGRRVIRTTHHPCWDAKNRFGLPDEMPLNDESIEKITSYMYVTDMAQEQVPEPTPEAAAAPTAKPSRIIDLKKIDIEKVKNESPKADPRDNYPAEYKPLVDLMRADGITDEMLRNAVGAKGYRPQECPVEQYPADFVQWLTSVWSSFVTFAKELD